MNRMEDRFDGKCQKHGYWSSNYMDECPKCAKDDYEQEMSAEGMRAGICITCYYYNGEYQYCCEHPSRKKFPTRPRKHKCVLYKPDTNPEDY